MLLLINTFYSLSHSVIIASYEECISSSHEIWDIKYSGRWPMSHKWLEEQLGLECKILSQGLFVEQDNSRVKRKLLYAVEMKLL